MDYELLKTFICLAKLKNFTKTAEQLHVVQSTITSRIKHLEHTIGETLFIRTNKKVLLTGAGEIFLPYAKQLLSIQETAISRLHTLELFKDTLNIGAVHSIYDCHVQNMILKYMQRNKKIAIKITIEHSEELIQMLHDNQLDVTFTYLDIKSSQFICNPFYTDKIILVTGSQNNYNERGITNDELRSLPLLSSAILTEEFQEWFYSIFPRNYIYPLDININSNIVTFLKDGIGFSFMPESAAKNFIEEGSLIEVKLLESTPPSMKSYVLLNKQRINSEAVHSWLNEFPTLTST
ncbi:LysR family transcriptional repressor of citA [Clostridium acetobutylicum]|uniref:Transcriptional regulator, LysR family n=1 Tax=Clostridium acetobutylicum (strain ATCC 824 / DSM 792 / JCM 1419 / IAM 19013 / LMG 5710 / NBRC 13948 / NRRL B-527 / VKM B-1787 / 2291 / W) TaxID=272562 RepID=Q97DK9_CLOAB|nr:MULTISPECIES: LysR family transcriptional regulator [Clostridium]AAK81394.1 Transcriptional regulator, LysR family [Clostridium acetobutylicum ATCC 824]ADZ22507.1 Transcriptional regulator, LysR family [Clostridium acetobutylicum EA 2018]AEI33231.1 LysR family transcriptional regulator [Clostridium acetobutylicum DSM 1731]AWV80938.1 LysR family transcriptional regulator [Clostridium acetobutylicum]MBC2393740.1 LysR family transcriptional regulator [Clostridium acetobutylicum]